MERVYTRTRTRTYILCVCVCVYDKFSSYEKLAVFQLALLDVLLPTYPPVGKATSKLVQTTNILMKLYRYFDRDGTSGSLMNDRTSEREKKKMFHYDYHRDEVE